jgi:hypothetical protein
MRSIIASVVLGYVIGAFFHQYDPQNAEFILYNLIPFGIALDNFYVAFQAFNNPVAVAQALILPQTEAQMLYAQLLPTLGYEFYLNLMNWNCYYSIIQPLIITLIFPWSFF